MSRTRARAVRAVAPVAGLLAAGLLVWQGSYAAFNATTDNTGDAWSTGSMQLTNNGGGTSYSGSTAALFSETGLNPGVSTGTKCITVESGGSLGGSLRIYRGAVTGDATLAGLVRLTVDAVALPSATSNVASDCTGFTAAGTATGIVSNVALPSFASTYSGTGMTVPNATTRVAYRIAWSLASAGSTAADNALQGKTAGASLIWELQ